MKRVVFCVFWLLTLSSLASADVTYTIHPQEHTFRPGETVEYFITVSNTGGATETVDFDVTGLTPGFSSTVVYRDDEILAGASIVATMRITANIGVSEGTYTNQVVVTPSSQGPLSVDNIILPGRGNPVVEGVVNFCRDSDNLVKMSCSSTGYFDSDALCGGAQVGHWVEFGDGVDAGKCTEIVGATCGSECWPLGHPCLEIGIPVVAEQGYAFMVWESGLSCNEFATTTTTSTTVTTTSSTVITTTSTSTTSTTIYQPPTENCCNQVDDDGDPWIDGEDTVDCQKDRGLNVGWNNICWATRWDDYAPSSDYQSGEYTCPTDHIVSEVEIIQYMEDCCDYFRIYDSSDSIVHQSNGDNGFRTIDVRGASTQSIYFEFTSDGSNEYDGVRVNRIECEHVSDQCRDTCISEGYLDGQCRGIDLSGTSCTSYLPDSFCEVDYLGEMCCEGFSDGTDCPDSSYDFFESCCETNGKFLGGYDPMAPLDCAGEGVTFECVDDNNCDGLVCLGTTHIGRTPCPFPDQQQCCCSGTPQTTTTTTIVSAPEVCCNDYDDDYDGLEDGEDETDCNGDVTLEAGANSVCWWTRWDNYASSSDYQSGLYTCPADHIVTDVDVTQDMETCCDYFEILDDTGAELHSSYGHFGDRVIDLSTHKKQSIRFHFTSDISQEYDGVKINSITCVEYVGPTTTSTTSSTVTTSTLPGGCLDMDATQYCAVTGGRTFTGEYITRVDIHGIDRSSGQERYLDATDSVTDPLVKTGVYMLRLYYPAATGQAGDCFAAWFDWNQDDNFDDGTERISLGCAHTGSDHIDGFVGVPSSAVNGPTMFRIMGEDGTPPGPCTDPSFNEIEDYSACITDTGTPATTTTTTSTTLPGPELIISDVIVSPNPPVAGQNNDLQVTVKNLGVVEVTNTDLYISFKAQGTSCGWTSKFVSSLPYNGETVFSGLSYFIDTASVGNDLLIDVDVNPNLCGSDRNYVSEVFEDNNQWNAGAVESPPMPDLIITDVQPSPDPPEGDATNSFDVTVKNVGSDSTGSATTYLSADVAGTSCQETSIFLNDLAPNSQQTYTMSFFINAGSAGQPIYFDVDYGPNLCGYFRSYITEEDETNNGFIGPTVLPDTMGLRNPGFESGSGADADNWDESFASADRSSDRSHDSTYSMKFIAPNTPQSVFQETVRVLPNVEYRLGGWIYDSLTSGNAYLDLNDIGEECEAGSTLNGQWEHVECTFTTGSSREIVTVRMVTDGSIAGNTGNVWFDDLELEPAAAAPEVCCNDADDDFDSLEDGEDMVDCSQPAVSLSPGSNSVCWWTRWNDYEPGSSYKSFTFECPSGYHVSELNMDVDTEANNDVISIYDDYTNFLLAERSGSRPSETVDVSEFKKGSVHMWFSSDSNTQYDGVKVNTITCGQSLDTCDAECLSRGFDSGTCRPIDLSGTFCREFLPDTWCTIDDPGGNLCCEGPADTDLDCANDPYMFYSACCGQNGEYLTEYDPMGPANCGFEGSTFWCAATDPCNGVCLGDRHIGRTPCADPDNEVCCCAGIGPTTTTLGVATEICCNDFDDDTDGLEDGEDESDCDMDVNLNTGTNNVCWWTRWNDYAFGSNYGSGWYICPAGNIVSEVSITQDMESCCDYFSIYNSGNTIIDSSNGQQGTRTLDLSADGTDRIRFEFTSDGSVQYDGVKVHTITCFEPTPEDCCNGIDDDTDGLMDGEDEADCGGGVAMLSNTVNPICWWTRWDDYSPFSDYNSPVYECPLNSKVTDVEVDLQTEGGYDYFRIYDDDGDVLLEELDGQFGLYTADISSDDARSIYFNFYSNSGIEYDGVKINSITCAQMTTTTSTTLPTAITEGVVDECDDTVDGAGTFCVSGEGFSSAALCGGVQAGDWVGFHTGYESGRCLEVDTTFCTPCFGGSNDCIYFNEVFPLTIQQGDQFKVWDSLTDCLDDVPAIPAGTNLEIVKLGSSWGQIGTYNSVDLNAYVKNTGTANAAATLYADFLVEHPNGDTCLADTRSTALNPREVGKFTVLWDTDIDVGTNTVTAFIDKDNTCGSGHDTNSETDETDNSIVETFDVAGPDLVITDVSTSPDPLDEGSNDITVTVENIGGSTAYDPITVKVNVPGEPCASANTFGQMDPGQTETVSISGYVLSANAGGRQLNASVDANPDVCGQDSDNTPYEEDESNNEYADGIVAGGGPDLQITDLQLSDTTPAKGDYITFTATVENTGSFETTIGWIYVDMVLDDGSCLCTGNAYVNMQPGDARTFSCGWTVNKVGTRTITAIVDGPNDDNSCANHDYIDEMSETNNGFPYNVDIAGPDLVIENFQMTPASPAYNEQVTLSADVRNTGTTATGWGTKYIYFSLDDGICPSIGNTYRNLDIAAGGVESFSRTWNANTRGTRTITASVDSKTPCANYDNTPETDESNNNATTAPFHIPGPDLQISNLVISDMTPAMGDSVTFTATVVNTGDEATSGNKYIKYVTNESECLIATSKNVNLAAGGGTDTITGNWNVNVAGKQTITAMIDRNHVCANYDYTDETDEGNNNFTSTLVDITPPDLVVESLEFIPSDPGIGENVILRATIRNDGTAKAVNSIYVMFQNATSCIGYRSTSLDINPGQSYQMSDYTWSMKWPGTQTITATVDRDIAGCNWNFDYNAEADETNNELANTFTVLQPDLIIESLQVEPASPGTNEYVTFRATVGNQGPGTAGYTIQVGFKNATTCIATSLSSNDIPPGGSLDITHSRYWRWPGAQTLTAYVDTEVPACSWYFDNHPDELDEGNNDLSTTFTVLQPDLEIVNVVPDPDPPAPGANYFDITVRNNGPGTAGGNIVVTYKSPGTSCVSRSTGTDIPSGGEYTFNNQYYNMQAASAGQGVMFDVDKADSLCGNDQDNNIETDETNNEYQIGSVSLPDLVVSNVATSPDPLAAGQWNDLDITIENQGAGPTDSSYIYTSVIAQGSNCNNYNTPYNLHLAPGESYTYNVQYYIYGSSSGENLVASVDASPSVCGGTSYNYNIESDETNNQHTIGVIT
ncbi:MAG: hypothetical protein GF416_05400 [Candidatus Altiarchaeales archaeon]|nr:hypothetical protein [Candidatus Altiarchaeales archaeon]MBD3416553.1 hypothetical protein [Candidatus Altiarchaeales archaeon]